MRIAPKTLKQRLFIQEYIETGNATEAAARAYDVKSRSVAKVIGSQNLTKLNFPDLIERSGLTDEALIKVLVEELTALKRYRHLDVPDWNARHRALELALKLKGYFAGPISDQQLPVPILSITTNHTDG